MVSQFFVNRPELVHNIVEFLLVMPAHFFIVVEFLKLFLCQNLGLEGFRIEKVLVSVLIINWCKDRIKLLKSSLSALFSGGVEKNMVRKKAVILVMIALHPFEFFLNEGSYFEVVSGATPLIVESVELHVLLNFEAREQH